MVNNIMDLKELQYYRIILKHQIIHTDCNNLPYLDKLKERYLNIKKQIVNIKLIERECKINKIIGKWQQLDKA